MSIDQIHQSFIIKDRIRVLQLLFSIELFALNIATQLFISTFLLQTLHFVLNLFTQFKRRFFVHKICERLDIILNVACNVMIL